MEQQTLADRIRNIIMKYATENNDTEFDINRELITIGIDSGNILKIIVDLENEFDIEFDDEELTVERFKSTASIIDYIKHLKS